ncbi:hypothetical protein [Frankia canadensis]|nr:hypothetical protein [Frankia canadensis]
MPPYYESAPHRGGLLDLAPRSTAPTDLIGRLLNEADRVGLTDEQIRMLLRVQRDYRAGQRALEAELALAAHEVRLTPEALAGRAPPDRMAPPPPRIHVRCRKPIDPSLLVRESPY